jgi:hypothetical protein
VSTDHVWFGRCRSGKRWFWIAEGQSYRNDGRHCDDPVCQDGMTGHEYGWESTEQAALDAMHAAISRLAGKPIGDKLIGRPTHAASALKRINAARRRARPPKPGATEAAAVEYLYEPWSWSDDYGETHKGINVIPIVKKTAKRVYYDNSSSWDRYEGTITLRYFSREEFETDTRCRDTCSRDIPADIVCAPHGRDFPHCVHFGEQDYRDPRHFSPRGCGETCPVDTPGFRCAAHPRATWEHCPHGNASGHCHHGSPAGVADLGGPWYRRGGTVYASREAAEEYLYYWEREQERKRADPEVKRLRMAMADAHPDRGGTNDGFIAARKAYEQALRRAS